MDEKILKGRLSISKLSTGLVQLTVTDEKSHIQFVCMEMRPEDFANCVFGLAERKMKMRVKCLRDVGKLKEIQADRHVLTAQKSKHLKISSYDSEALSKYLVEHMQRKGWILNSYLGSKSSVEHLASGAIALNFSYTRYVAKKA